MVQTHAVGRWLFKYRSFTPIPWILAAVAFARPLGAWSWAGVGVLLAGEAVRFWALGCIGPESRVTRQGPGASQLVTWGPYGWVRNPLYIGNFLVILGLALWSGALWPWLPLAAGAFFLWQYALITAAEGAELEKRYGWEYRSYSAVVPSWVPRFTPHPMLKNGRFFLTWPAVRGELRTLLTICLVGAAVPAAAWLKTRVGVGW